MTRMDGKLALVTGAAQGLGAAIAAAFAQQGARVLLTDVNADGAAARAAAIDAEHGGGTAFALRHDVTDEADWQAAMDAARERMGGLSVLVNNAGIGLMGSVEDIDLAGWRRCFAVNSDAVFLGCKHALPLLREHQPGAIVNISSIAAMVASPVMPAYNASKAAVVGLTRSVALHAAHNGWDIRCNSVHPCFVDTPILDGMSRGGAAAHDATKAKLARQIPVGRVGEPEEVAALVVHLASDESRFTTGAQFKIDGGISAQ